MTPAELSVWADVDEVPGKGDAARVVLVGESTARGYLLDPVTNPTRALQRHLDTVADRRFQCLDLARTSIDLPDLHRLVRASGHLDADHLVVLAGNNWTTWAYELSGLGDATRLADGLRRDGYPGLRRALFDEVLNPRIGAFLDELLRLRDRTGVQPLLVIPEFNLTGWSPVGGSRYVDVPTLRPDELRRWYDLRARAVAALAAQRWTAVQGAAREMVALDGGLSPVPGYLLGRALLAAGDAAAARQAFEQSRDSLCGLMVKYLPRTPRMIQEQLVTFCREHDVPSVDLRVTLARADQPELPDEQCFLDYCHLSDVGVERAMAEVAGRLTGRTVVPGATDPTVGAWQRAVSLVLAATYNAFCGQPAETVRPYLHRAVEADPDIVDLLASLARLLSRPGPMWSSLDLPRLAREPSAAVMFERLGEYRPDQSRLWFLRQCLAELLAEPAESAVEVAEAAPPSEVELLDIATTPLGGGAVLNYTDPRCYLQANVPTTELPLGLPRPAAGCLRLVHRCREAGPEPAVVTVNGTPVGRLVAGRQWRTTELAVGADVTRVGLNTVRVGWPVPTTSLSDRIDSDVAALARGAAPYVLPVFGELYSVRFVPYAVEGEA
ncbi:hypothetical protein [Micromonospora okii]|uniref:hypothetical protein n=1 Tax=Micromonospora okii TaxID=1182970 RepID=UPI001E3654D3|nr:hypothetical protein [Micromonospora okii]